MLEGILLVDKPKGWTSFDVVAYIRKLIAEKYLIKPIKIKVGHTGTLDPLATGLLVILIGKKYTKIAPKLSGLKKEYSVEVKLGYRSKSYDIDSTLEKVSKLQPQEDKVKEALFNFLGETLQTPPIYSAKKINGQRAYKMARAGQEVKLNDQKIKVYSITNFKYKYPKISFKMLVSSGTYIRSIVNDLGLVLEVGAVMTNLKRTKVGEFKLSEAINLKNVAYNLLEKQIIHKEYS